MKAEKIAQTMLDRHGYFVICFAFPVPIGHVGERIIDSNPVNDKGFHAKYAVVGYATERDFANQCELAGVKPEDMPASHRYRAVAE